MNKKEDKSVKIKEEIEYNERELRPEFIKEMKQIEKEPTIRVEGDLCEYFKKRIIADEDKD
ncbi:hypothetical protein [Methanobacterium sp. MBAC-LM]|uniref:hypothetical protein n=1 Tax=Methanobacterium sp. MBAC-LM TaxID=3412034 RepID=UPI003C760220